MVATRPDMEWTGDGDITVVLLHGWGLEGSSWEPLQDHLNPFLHTVAPDLWGFGDNAREETIPSQGSVARSVDELLALCHAIGSRPLIAVRASRGGLVALSAAARNPETFAAVVTICRQHLLIDRSRSRYPHRSCSLPVLAATSASRLRLPVQAKTR
jgi:pimeloyl-ACP methyl ester carboxylesterase